VGGLMVAAVPNAEANHFRGGRNSGFSISIGTGRGASLHYGNYGRGRGWGGPVGGHRSFYRGPIRGPVRGPVIVPIYQVRPVHPAYGYGPRGFGW
jgi:hypothetical protein